MKIVMMTGSAHRNGTTATLAGRFQQGALDAGHEVYRFDAAFQDVHPCIGCDKCRRTGTCTFAADDMKLLNPHLLAADAVVFVSPIYYFTINAQLKAVIDRFQRYFEARFARGIRPAIETHRDAVLLLTMGRYDPFAVEVCEKTLRQSFSVMNTTLKKTVVLPDTDRADCENSSIFAKAQEIAIEIAREL